MSRWKTVLALLAALTVSVAQIPTHADIYSWDTGEVIPGTEGIEPGPGVQLSGWNTEEHNLRYADFSGGLNLTDADFSVSWLDQADFSGQNLTNASLSRANLSNANLVGANLRNSNLFAAGLRFAEFAATTIYNQWTVFPLGFDAAAAGLTIAASPPGDLNADDVYDVSDIDSLTARIRTQTGVPYWLPNAAFDLNTDDIIDFADHRVWVKDLAHTWYGDADLSGEFDSSDFVQVFTVGEYESTEEAGWSEGDWNGDGVFDSDDFVIAFQDGGYEQGPRTDAVAVPEPSTAGLLLTALCMVFVRVHRVGH